MPKYSFQCNQCGKNFTVNVPWEEKENTLCPNCGSKDKSTDYSSVGVMSGSACPTRKMRDICPSTGAA
ncbi:MAG: FmdB family zinc ribbon protein [Dehalobacterium sp.]